MDADLVRVDSLKESVLNNITESKDAEWSSSEVCFLFRHKSFRTMVWLHALSLSTHP